MKCLTTNSRIFFVPEVTTDLGPGVVETGNYEELAKDEETFEDELGVEETSDKIEDLLSEL